MAQPHTDEHERDGDMDDDELDGYDGDEEGTSTDLVLRDLPEGVKVFEVAFSEKPPIPFALLFINETTGGREVHQFEAVGDAGAGGPLAVSTLLRFDPRGRQMVDLNAMLVFFDRVLIEGDADRLRDVLDRRDLVISMDQLAEVFNWLMEKYTGRPTPPSSDSAASRPARGRSSKAKRR